MEHHHFCICRSLHSAIVPLDCAHKLNARVQSAGGYRLCITNLDPVVLPHADDRVLNSDEKPDVAQEDIADDDLLVDKFHSLHEDQFFWLMIENFLWLSNVKWNRCWWNRNLHWYGLMVMLQKSFIVSTLPIYFHLLCKA